MHNLLKTTQFRVLFDAEEPPEALAPTDGSDPLREIEIKSPTTKISKIYIFQHRLRSLNEFLPPSVKARQEAQAAKNEKRKTKRNKRRNSTTTKRKIKTSLTTNKATIKTTNVTRRIPNQMEVPTKLNRARKEII